MSEHSVIVRDLETVPDLAAAGRLFDAGDATEAEVREALERWADHVEGISH
jgi:hypothetical protein